MRNWTTASVDRNKECEQGETFMKRNVRLEDISDGKLYTANDLVKADCHDCEGCSACCSGMASIVLDPLMSGSCVQDLGKALKD